jgi:hypothetical protein
MPADVQGLLTYVIIEVGLSISIADCIVAACIRILNVDIVGVGLGTSAVDCVVGAGVCQKVRTVVDHDAGLLPDEYLQRRWWWTTPYEGISLAVYNSWLNHSIQ